MLIQTDQTYLTQALALATLRRGFCSPNPSVGAIIVQNNQILATGHHHAAGSPHAEIDALQKLSMQAQGATIYITLMPCCHWGKTPPCTDALIQAGIKRVVYGHPDLNPEVMEKSVSLLEAKGILCEYIPIPEITTFYESYDHWRKTKTPNVTAKIAITLNGKIAGPKGERIQITGQALHEFTHQCRKNADAILTTIKTIVNDAPQLNARIKNETIAKPIYLLDSNLNFPLTATVLKTAKSLTIFHAKAADCMRQQTLQQSGVQCIAVDKNEHGLDLKQVLQYIGQQGIHDLWVEAGGKCFAALMKQNLLQRALIYVAPHWLADGQAAFENKLDFSTAKIQWKQVGTDALCDVRW